MCGAEQNVAGADRGHRVLYPVTAGSGGDEIELVALMRNLWAVCGPSGEPYLQIPVNEDSADRPGARGRASAAASDICGGV